MRDLPRIVADTPVGKEANVVVIRKGKEETLKVTVGRLRTTKRWRRSGQEGCHAGAQSVVQKTLGLELSNLNAETRKKYKIKDAVKGVRRHRSRSRRGERCARKHLAAGDVIVEVQYQGVGTPDDLQKRIDDLKSQGKKVAVLLVSNGTGRPGSSRCLLIAARLQSSTWLTMPSASFGSNQVDFGGMIAPASATAMRSLICVG